MQVPVRHPYSGELVFTAFSGSHQDAIQKGMAAWDDAPDAVWEVPYLPIDPKDIGRTYEAIIRINSQSGKGGVAYVMENEFGFQLPKAMRVEFGKIINAIADDRGDELTPQQIYAAFEHEYLQRTSPFSLEAFHAEKAGASSPDEVVCRARVILNGELYELSGSGNGPIDAFVRALNQASLANFTVRSYTEHSLNHGSDARAVAYLQIETPSGRTFFGAAIATNIEQASIKAVLNAMNRVQATMG